MSSNNNTNAADPLTLSAGMANPPGAGFEHGHTPTEKTVHDSVMVDATVVSRGGGPGGEGQHSAPAAPEAPPGLPKPAVPHEHRFFVHPFLNIVVCNCGIGKDFGDHFSSAGTDGDMTAVEARAAILSASHVAAPAAQANTATSDSRDAYQLRSDNKRLRTERQAARDEAASARRRISVLEEQVEGLRKRYEEVKREVEDLEDVRDHLRVDASLMAYECEARRAAEEALADAAARRVVPPPTVRGHITGREYDTMKPVIAPCLNDFLKAKIREP
ncbi:uncharacterized protein SCHCODRAFT_02705117 [Schizophyllum commune H4-8]|uniref:Uncharacterized protein n=1 Tax=Schizophyllum commune (strain H4-8 / FGSC 9210) TaxID=578458 RepID=D8QFU3_SCHCM|nr:uncharacterized protein SCHCODRAFT_02705117 [Schizophyllum commune H4-8]KAI5887785.1 hypothetical protein SCHCODRAFT_02705117 [Schizophyllum commune H4-8]